jgi:hypothetical protein
MEELEELEELEDRVLARVLAPAACFVTPSLAR